MESSALDYVAQACMELSEAIAAIDSTKSETERETLITNHIKKVWNTVTPVEDFKKNLEWVNVSEPLSLSQHCSDKLVLMDFWTYCCINCYHVLPDLAYLEERFADDGLVVVGVHCAKFLNEKDSSNVLAAVDKYNLQHPVVNDAESVMWDALGIKCWPTLLLLGPGNKPLFIFTGEGHREELDSYITLALKYFGTEINKTPISISLSKNVIPRTGEVLRFPTKIAPNPFYRGRIDEPFMAISDTGYHRVLLTDCGGLVLQGVGGPDPGFRDGSFRVARFNCPQGLCWLSSNVIAVCDTNNHTVRAVHLDTRTVDVLAGTGKQAAYGDLGGKCLGMQPLSSPWDIVLFTTPDMDMSVRPQLPPGQTAKEGEDNKDGMKIEKVNEKRVLLIACAGSHQIWALFLDTTIWWKYKSYTEGTCVCVAGSGQEAARNSTYPHTAAFAQPTGLALRTGSCPELFIADSESSSIRRLSLSTGQVTTLCGGDRNPLNLFAFGDVDDIGQDAKLQHPMGVAFSEHYKTLYIADTFNNKIKKVDITTQKVTTINCLKIESTDLVTFNEPNSLAISLDGKYLYVCDTNNHNIKIINTSKNVSQDFKVIFSDPSVDSFTEPENMILYRNDLFVNRKCGTLVIYFDVTLDTGTRNVKYTPGAPQHWSVLVRDQWNKDVSTEDFEFHNSSLKGTRLPGRVQMRLRSKTDKTHYKIYLSFNSSLCDGDGSVCFNHRFTIRSKILVRDSVKMIESYKITCKVNPMRDQNNSH